jgi:hypothetical protein
MTPAQRAQDDAARLRVAKQRRQIKQQEELQRRAMGTMNLASVPAARKPGGGNAGSANVGGGGGGGGTVAVSADAKKAFLAQVSGV